MSAKVLSDRGIAGAYYNRLEQGPVGWAGAVSFDFESDQDSEDHKWLGMAPAMREWVGGKNAKGLRDQGFTIKNKDWESTMDYHRRHLTEDKTGQFQVRLNEHMERVDALWARELSTLIINGESSVCYDGQYFFDTDHSEGDSGTLSNDIQVDISAAPVGTHGSTTAPSVSEMNHAILKSIEQMYGFKDDQGEPLNETARKFLVMVPTPFWATAVSAVKNSTVDQGDTNTVLNLEGYEITVQHNSRLNAWTTKFATFRMDGAVAPFIRQIREQPTVVVKGENSDYYFDTGRKQVSIEMAGNVGYGLWQHAVLATLI